MLLQLIEGYKNKDKNLKHLLERYEFHILPILNPDGYAYTYAENGVSKIVALVQWLTCKLKC